VALDQHTGREVASYTPPGSVSNYTGMVFDPINEVVYVGTAPYFNNKDNSTPGTLIALDARTLAEKWTFTTPAGIDATPALSGTALCFGDRTAVVYCIDTRQAVAAAAQNQPIPTRWTSQLPIDGPTHRISTPLFADDQVITTDWEVDYDPSGGLSLLQAFAFAVSDGSVIADPLNFPSATVPRSEVDFFFIVQPPILGYASFPGFTAPTRTLFIRAATKVIAYNLENYTNNQQTEFDLPSGVISSGLVYDDGTRLGSGLSPNGTPPTRTRLWFGDNQGNLWSLDNQLGPADGTPYQVTQNTQVATTPTLYKDPQGGLTVLYGVSDPNNTLPPSLYGYDPDNGNHASVPTGVTSITTLSPTVINGVVYAGGWGVGVTQVFGIRVDELPQALRDFVIESQMMQDPDPSGSGNITPGQPLPANPIPNSVARYQTHLTVVDDQKNPQIHEPVKIWCDTANTNITVDGQGFTVGPDDASFAAVQTGADGSLVITMDATDYVAPTLRVWASFMNPFERIVVNPDAEFHERVMTAHADASDTDPTKVNLMTATNYKGTSLFTADEKNQNPSQPQNVANSIQQVNKGLGLSGANNTGMYRKLMRAMGVKHKNQRIRVQWIENASPLGEGSGVGATPDKYMAYAGLPGATPFPTNIPAARLASIVQPVGLSYSRPNGDVTQAPTFTALSHTDASAAIDALQGEPWKPTDPQGGMASAWQSTHMRTFNIFQDFWNWLKGFFDKVLQCVLSIGEDILAGIQYLVGTIVHVFKAVIKVLEDVFPFLGSFFKMLEKAIDDVVAALSVLFHFGEIIKTHTFLRGELLGRMPQIKLTITSQILPAVDRFFQLGEDAITGFFDQLRGQLAPNQAVSGLRGMGSTAHSAYSIKASDGSTSSLAVQGSWATQKLKTGLGSATGNTNTSVANARPASVGDDPIADAVTAFLNRITGNGDLSQAFDQLQHDVGQLLNPSSATQFFSTLLTTLLDILETLLIGVLAVGNALADSLLGVVGNIIDALFDPENGLLVAPLDIPILSWLYQQLFGEPLTFVSVILLVAAIPVTLVYRVAVGRYPSEDLPPVGALGTDGGNTPQQATDAAKVIGIVIGLFSGIVNMIGGVVNCLTTLPEKAPPTLGKVSVAVAGLLAASSFPISDLTNPDWYDLAEFGLGLVGFALGLVGLKTFEEATQQLLELVLPWMNSLDNIGLLVTYIVQAVEEGISNGWQFAAGVISTLSGILSPLTFGGEVGRIVLGAVTGVVGFAVGALYLVAALTSTSEPESVGNT